MNRKRRETMLVFGAPAIGEEEISEVVSSLRSGWLGTGPKVAQFESDFAKYKGIPTNLAAAVNSGTAALHISMVAAGIGPGDEVITTSMTFCATVNAIIHAGATPVLVDIDPKTGNIDPERINEHINARTKAIVPVHFGGLPCDMDAILALAERYHLLVIEDCAHAIETEYRGNKTGTFGDFGCFSFYVTKNVVSGEGGMIITRHEELLNRVKILSLHGMSKDAWHRFGDKGFKHYQVVECGFKYNMMDLQAAIGLHQLARVESNWLRRRQIWCQYKQAFANLPIGCPMEPPAYTRHAYHLYTIRIHEGRTGTTRDAFVDGMTARNIGVGVHYLAIPEHPYYQQRFGWRAKDFPNAMRLGRETVSIPLSAALSDEDVEDVIQAVRDSLEEK